MAVSINDMRDYLSRSYSSRNTNKVFGVLAEADFYQHVTSLGFQDRLSPGGWLQR
jgi:hypothetical protein